MTDVDGVFAADIECHDLCIRNYLRKYSKALESNNSTTSAEPKRRSPKNTAIFECISKILLQLHTSVGFTLSHISEQLENVRNRDVKLVLDEMFGDKVSYVIPREASKPTLFYLSTVSVEDVINTLRARDEFVDCEDLRKQRGDC